MTRADDNTHFDPDVRDAIESDPEFAAGYFEELRRRPLPVQFRLLRKFLGLSQAELARSLGLKQTHISRLEKDGSDHLLSLYERAAGKLGAHVAIVPVSLVALQKRAASSSRRRRAE
jgi:DNA-binding XRE family transcriptional regulator